MALGAAAFAVVLAIVLLIADPVPIAGGELGEQRQDAESGLFFLAFLVLLPLSLLVSPRIADRIAAGPGGATLPALAGLLAASLLGVILLVRLADLVSLVEGPGALLAALVLWWAGAALVLTAALGPRSRPWLRALAGRAAAIWALAGIVAFALVLGLTDLGSVSWPALALAPLAAAGVLAAARRWPARPSGGWGLALEALIVGALALAVPDLVIFRPEDATSGFDAAFETGVIQLHQDFLLGPANQVLGGAAMLVDTASQYGVGSIYFLAGWFEVAPIGYGTFGFLDGAVTALYFVCGYALLRVAGCSRAWSAAALALALAALVYNLVYPVGALPQQGPLRFGLPPALILAIVVGERWPRRAGAAWAAAMLVLAVAAVWSLEAFAATAITLAAMAAAKASLMPAGRLRWLGRRAALAAAACVAAHVLFALATLAAAGELPDWGQYLAYLEEFLFGQIGDITYDVSRWSPAMAVGAGYLISAAAVVLLISREGDLARRQRTALVAEAGLTAYGIVVFAYFVNRSADHVLAYVSLPALLSGAIWLRLLVGTRTGPSRAPGAAATGFALATAALVLAVAWSSVGSRFTDSALGHALPRGEGLRDALDRLWDPPPLDPRAPPGEELLARYMPGERHSVVLVTADLGTEVLIRSGRANTLPIGDVREDSFVPDERIPGLVRAIDDLRPGDRLLTDVDSLRALAFLRAHPLIDPLDGPRDPRTVSPLQRWALARIDERFRLRTLIGDELGFAVLELGPRRPGARP